jgi:hypothetical protein
VQDPDVSVLTFGRRPTPEPVLVEGKVRPVISLTEPSRVIM